VVAPAGEGRSARLLLVSWHFPPDSAVGGLRWQKFARHAAERGWGVEVIMRDPSRLCGCDPDRLSDLPAGTRLYFVRQRRMALERFAEIAARLLRRFKPGMSAGGAGMHASPSPGSFARDEIRWRSVRDVKRAYFAVVEHWRGARWAADASAVGRQLVQPGVHRAIVSSGPPHFVHSAACNIGRATALPPVMDLRDPWSMVQRLPENLASPVALALARYAEQRAIRNASLIVANTEPARDMMAQQYPAAAKRIIAIPNG